MPSPSYKELHVTIRHPTDNTLLGCGWLLTNKVIITCAHVLWSESRRLYYDSVDIVVTFKDNVRFSAHVHDKITNEPRRRDLAILTPTHIAFEPKTSEKYGILAPIPGLRCASLGVPGEWDGIGNWAEYIVGEELPNSWTQLIGSTNRGFEIRAGFSGAPVWDD